ncbi:hypothetical protein [Natronolimnohabitans innermongolicus]|uniref:UspA domain-containing protein n=1 Tax=Natronolimnohabitans innermongolicus JCM 12255 TaxID=1227499 RepID=L9WHI8_9EURY|nr:hypothetical protein [Natronolimnohabitans innermongolicus]ELY48909.1 hypothetical protein C493_21516 [Natronolimnohabitans innermongolicus JCM 12255]
MHYLAGATSVHTTAAICDYLDERATADDTVTVVAVVSATDAAGPERRDAQEALNVAPVRLAAVGRVETELRETDAEPADVLRDVATAVGADELLVTPQDGDPSVSADSDDTTESQLGSTARALAADTPVPVVVVPAPKL